MGAQTKMSTQGSTRLKYELTMVARTNLEVRLFNTAVTKMAAQMQRKSRPQDGRPQGTSQRNTRHIRKMGAQMQHKAHPQDGRPNAKQIRNEKRPHKGALGKKTS
jgi:hypothetical protein